MFNKNKESSFASFFFRQRNKFEEKRSKPDLYGFKQYNLSETFHLMYNVVVFITMSTIKT
jgi:hypothetical protein